MKKFFGDRRFKINEEVKDAVQQWLNGPAAEVYDEGMQKLVTRHEKCLDVCGHYVKKKLRGL
jgi:hypothetical protein